VSTKIAFIGAGSVEFTKNLLGDILTFPELSDARIALHDIDAERLEAAEAIARWTNGALDASASITSHLERREALEGADYVVNMVQVGMHKATVLDFEVPLRHGLRQTIGDTLGVGGIFRALRTIPVMLGIAEDMSREWWCWNGAATSARWSSRRRSPT
jgi:alpha-galactosidase